MYQYERVGGISESAVVGSTPFIGNVQWICYFTYATESIWSTNEWKYFSGGENNTNRRWKYLEGTTNFTLVWLPLRAFCPYSGKWVMRVEEKRTIEALLFAFVVVYALGLTLMMMMMMMKYTYTQNTATIYISRFFNNILFIFRVYGRRLNVSCCSMWSVLRAYVSDVYLCICVFIVIGYWMLIDFHPPPINAITINHRSDPPHPTYTSPSINHRPARSCFMHNSIALRLFRFAWTQLTALWLGTEGAESKIFMSF